MRERKVVLLLLQLMCTRREGVDPGGVFFFSFRVAEISDSLLYGTTVPLRRNYLSWYRGKNITKLVHYRRREKGGGEAKTRTDSVQRPAGRVSLRVDFWTMMSTQSLKSGGTHLDLSSLSHTHTKMSAFGSLFLLTCLC